MALPVYFGARGIFFLYEIVANISVTPEDPPSGAPPEVYPMGYRLGYTPGGPWGISEERPPGDTPGGYSSLLDRPWVALSLGFLENAWLHCAERQMPAPCLCGA